MLYFVVETPRKMEKPPRSSGQEQRHGMEVHGLRDQLGSWIVAILPICVTVSPTRPLGRGGGRLSGVI
jgi:hypothetical protein